MRRQKDTGGFSLTGGSLHTRDAIRQRGLLRLYKRRVGEERWRLVASGENVLTNAGAGQAHSLLWGEQFAEAAYGWLALGSDDTAPAASDTALVSENATSRVAFTGTTVASTRATIKVYFSPSKGNGTIKEWGIFNAAAGGTMFNRGLVQPSVTKTSTEEMLAEVIIDLS